MHRVNLSEGCLWPADGDTPQLRASSSGQIAERVTSDHRPVRLGVTDPDQVTTELTGEMLRIKETGWRLGTP